MKAMQAMVAVSAEVALLTMPLDRVLQLAVWAADQQAERARPASVFAAEEVTRGARRKVAQ